MDNVRRRYLALCLAVLALLLAWPGAALAGGPIGSAFVIGDRPAPVDAVHPSLAHNSIFGDYLVVWQNDRPGFDDIYGQRVSGDSRLVGGWRAIAAGAGAERRTPDVAHNLNFNEYLVVWEHTDSATGALSIRGQRVDSNGSRVGKEFTISGPGPKTVRRPRVAHAFQAGLYLVVWEQNVQGSPASDIAGQMVVGDGTLWGAPFVIAQGTWQHTMGQPDLAYNRARNEFLVTWNEEENNPSRHTNIRARRITGNGTPLQPPALQVTNYVQDSTNPAVAAIPEPPGKGGYLVAWELHASPGNRHVYARLIDGEGGMTIPVLDVAWSPRDEFAPAVAGNEQSQRFLVTWITAEQSLFLGHAREATMAGDMAPPAPLALGVFADHPAASSGPLASFLVAFDGQTLASNLDVHGVLWGERVYVPLVLHGPP
jgi:hypothetical protein